MKTVRIKDIEDPRIAPYKSLKTRHPKNDGLFVVENAPSVKALLESEIDVVSCVTTDHLYETYRKVAADSGKSNIVFYLMRKSDIENLIGFRFNHNVMMAAKLPEKRRFSRIERLLPSPRFVVGLNNVHDPQNVGLITRNIAAFGANAMVVDSETHEPYYRKVARVSMGSLFRVKIAYEDNLEEFLKIIKDKGTRVIVPSLSDDSTDLDRADFTGDICIIMGNEAEGASRAIRELADVRVRIPHHFEKVDSLNVACASSILMFQAYLGRR